MMSSWPNGLHARGNAVRNLEEGSLRESFTVPVDRRVKHVRSKRLIACITFVVAACVWLCFSAWWFAVERIVKGWLSRHGGECASAADVALHAGVPTWIALHAPHVLCTSDLVLWNPVEVSREGKQRSAETSRRCPAARVHVRASSLTVDALSRGRTRRHTVKGAEAACVQRMLDTMNGVDPCVGGQLVGSDSNYKKI